MARILYKYSRINLNLINSLSDQYLFFSNPNNFNDPFDSNLNYLLDKKILWSSGNSKLEDAIKTTKNRLGICCFSESHDNLHMWSHYADSHTGLCIGYDIDVIEEYFSKNSIGISAKRINYINTPLIYSNHGFYGLDENGIQHFYKANPNSMWDLKYLDKAVENLVLQKNEAIWKNEREHRMIAHPFALQTGTANNIIEAIRSQGFKIKLPKQAVSSIYLGCKISKENIELIEKVTAPEISINRSGLSSTNWNLEFTQKTRLN